MRSVSVFICLLALFFVKSLQAQPVAINVSEYSFELFSAGLELPMPSMVEENTVEGMFLHTDIPGTTTRMEIGSPALPVFSKIIEVPLGAEPQLSVDLISKKTLILDNPVYPFQPSLSKSDDPAEAEFHYNKARYQDDADFGVEYNIKELGFLRDKRLFLLSVSPFIYSPAKSELCYFEKVSVKVVFENADLEKTIQFKSRFGSVVSFPSKGLLSLPTDPIPTNLPITYVIVSDRMFESQLQEFIQWKTQKGYRVIVGYTDVIGTTGTAIKTWLEDLYLNPSAGYSPPQYLLLAGDVSQIPAWSGTAGSHKTDLYYAEYTGDKMPELFYGRFSANTAAELQPQIDKTLEYERNLFPSPAFLDSVVMVAGADASHSQTYGNGQINYGTGYYFNSAHGITSHTFLQPEPSGAGYSAAIKQHISNGVAYANYTAHCGVTGWSNPSFTNNDVASMTNTGAYGLLVGNCCQSATFSSTCFGEVLLRAENKGALGYIGGTNNTYWNEDFWWGVGVEPISANPVYNSGNLGAYDRKFHDMPGISREDWYVAQGAMTVAGNLAVTQSGSSRTNYYWEIYTLLGDPSLVVWLSQPDTLPLTYSNPVQGSTELIVSTVSDALVAVKVNETVEDVQLATSSSVFTLNMPQLSGGDTVIITATHHDYFPVIDTIIIEADVDHIISLTEGWNGISTYLNLSDSVTENIMAQLAGTLIIMKDMTSAYWPPYANNIPYWKGNAGYLVKVTEDCQLTLSGVPSTGDEILLSEGWNMISVRSQQTVDVVTLFENCVENLIIVKATDGSGVYWPSVNINSIGSLQPGKAYMVKVEEDCLITF